MSTRGLDRNGFRNALVVMVVAMVTVSILAVGAFAIGAFDRAVEPELTNRTRLIGLSGWIITCPRFWRILTR